MSEFMRRAIEISIQNVINGTGGPFGCVIVKDGVIVAEGGNKVTIWNDPTAHAEVVTIRNACNKLKNFNLKGCELYTSCYPCPMCYGAIRWSGIEKIFYSNTKKDAHDIGFSDFIIYEEILNQNQKLIELKDEKSIEAFKLWSKSKNKTEY